ncbi:ABC transporter permease [Streptomyces caniscabiei]|uniref:ABC transporter permease n=1 Tax=Streptomyces caniscabiei TaxID=2746961 RepID=UPI0029A33205|nr:ABC transporter permease [Streptomyces caniscabiei]MDX2776137.1 ABC transporter permease [Streptomyces caniscabiei]
MHVLKDTWTMAKRSLKHIVRSPDTIITVVITPIVLLLMFVYVLGGALGQQTGGVDYINYIAPGIIVYTVISGISYAAFRINGDIQKGIINRFRTMPVAPSSILSGQALSSALSNLVSSLLVLAIAFAIGFRTDAGMAEWLLFIGLLALFTLATTWMAIFFGLNAKSAEGASSFSFILIFLIFLSPSFVPTSSMTPFLRGFAENQPFTPIIETMRSLLTSGTPGDKIWIAFAWCAGILLVMYVLSVWTYKKKTA